MILEDKETVGGHTERGTGALNAKQWAVYVVWQGWLAEF